MSGKPSGTPVHVPLARRPPVRRAFREIVFVAALFLVYKLGRILVEGHVGAAMTNAQDVWDFERALHLPSEASLQATVLSHLWWIKTANCFYAYVHFPATAAALIWLYLRRPEIYVWFRRTLASLTALALVIHAVFPLAPPRMLATAGLVDTGHLYGPSVYGSPSTDTLSNQYAAMPSLHVGWALAVAIALITATRSRWRWLWLGHPVATLLVVVVTGNHYWLDAIAAVVVLAVVLAVVTPLSRQPAESVPPSGSSPVPASSVHSSSAFSAFSASLSALSASPVGLMGSPFGLTMAPLAVPALNPAVRIPRQTSPRTELAAGALPDSAGSTCVPRGRINGDAVTRPPGGLAGTRPRLGAPRNRHSHRR